jgi:hypothetical protein
MNLNFLEHVTFCTGGLTLPTQPEQMAFEDFCERLLDESSLVQSSTLIQASWEKQTKYGTLSLQL